MLRRGVFFLVLTLGLTSAAHAQRTVAEQYLLSAVNQERASRNLPLVNWDRALASAAYQHAREMANHRTISHQFAGEAELSERGAAAGSHFSRITENVAEAPTALTAHSAWMQSPGHRANILDPKVDAIGIAVLLRDGQLYAVQDFAYLTQNLTLTQQETRVAFLLEHAGLTLLPATGDARQACEQDSGHEGIPQPGFIMRYTAGSLDNLPSQIQTHITSGRYHQAAVGACTERRAGPFSGYRIAILLYP